MSKKSVKVFVSQSSIRDAHNLDDLRQRWLDRRTEYNRYRQVQEKDFSFEYSIPENVGMEKARELRNIATNEDQALKNELTILGKQKNSVWKQARKEELLARHQYVLEWIRIYKVLIIQLSNEKEKLEPSHVLLDSITSSGDDISHELIRLAYALLKELARSKRVELTRQEGAIIGALREYLARSKKNDI